MPSYATGPSRVSRGPVVGAYAEGDAISRACTNCGADVGSFCRRSDGTLKPAPCCTRLRPGHGDTADGALGAPRGAETAAIDQSSQPDPDVDSDCTIHGVATWLVDDGHEVVHYCDDRCPTDCELGGEETGEWCHGPLEPRGTGEQPHD